MKLVLKPVKPNCYSEGKQRITIQLRNYDKDGNYDNLEYKGNETIHIKNASLNEAFEIIKCALMNSKLIDSNFEVE
jgi:hypothetical protein